MLRALLPAWSPSEMAKRTTSLLSRRCLPADSCLPLGCDAGTSYGPLMSEDTSLPTVAYTVGRGNEPPDERREIAAAVIDTVRRRVAKALVSAYADSDFEPLPPDAEAARLRLTGGSGSLRARTRHVDFAPVDESAWDTIYAFAPWSSVVELEDPDEDTVATFYNGWPIIVRLTEDEKRALVSRLGPGVRVCESQEVLPELRAQGRRALRRFVRFLFGRGG